MTTLQIAEAHITNIGKPIEKQSTEIYSCNVVTHFPFAPTGHTSELIGAQKLTKFLAAIGEFTIGHKIKDKQVSLTESGFLIQYTETSVFKSTGNNYESQILWIATIQDQNIQTLAEYYNPINVLQALGDFPE
ncbi:MAG: nuclear transport factor 2 family protein [Fimbriimonadaceae bacterium]